MKIIKSSPEKTLNREKINFQAKVTHEMQNKPKGIYVYIYIERESFDVFEKSTKDVIYVPTFKSITKKNCKIEFVHENVQNGAQNTHFFALLLCVFSFFLSLLFRYRKLCVDL